MGSGVAMHKLGFAAVPTPARTGSDLGGVWSNDDPEDRGFAKTREAYDKPFAVDLIAADPGHDAPACPVRFERKVKVLSLELSVPQEFRQGDA